MRSRRRDDPPGVGLHDRRQRRTFLIGVPSPRIERLPVHEAASEHHLGRFVEAAQELVCVDAGRGCERLPAAVHEDQTGASGPEVGGRPRSRDDRPEAVTREDDPIGIAVAEQSRALGDRDGVASQDIEVVAAVLGRRVGQAVTAQVQSHEPSRATAPGEPAGRGAQIQPV